MCHNAGDMQVSEKTTVGKFGCALTACALLCASAASAAERERFDRGLLWSVSKDGAVVAHVFGTLHSNDARVLKVAQSPTVDGLLRSSENFGMEAFPKTRYFNPHWGYKSVLNDMMLPDGGTLEQLTGPELYAKVRERLIQNGVPADRIIHLKPWAAMHSLTMRKSKSDGAGGGGEIQDSWLFERAADITSNLYQVETLEELIASYYSFPLDAQVGLLNDRANFYGRMEAHREKMTEAYLAEDLDGMLANNVAFISAKSEKAGFKDKYLKHVLRDRNVVMAHYMLAPMRKGKTFFALGALHIQGEKGVLGILRDTYGFEVRRVMVK